MKQLKINDVIVVINKMKKSGMTEKEIKEMPIYIGDDDELNGIHTAWYVNIVDPNTEEDAEFIYMINEEGHNIKCNGKCILIS